MLERLSRRQDWLRLCAAARTVFSFECLDVSILRGRMARRQIGSGAKELLAQCTACGIGLRISAAALQFRHQTIDDVLKGFMRHGVSEIEAVHIRFLDPFLQNVRYPGGRADEDRTDAANAAPRRQLLDRPGAIAASQVLDQGMDRVGLLLLDDVIRRETSEIDAAPTR